MPIIADGATSTAVWASNPFAMEKLTIGLPGETMAEIDTSHLGLTAWKTMRFGTFKDNGTFTITGHYDPALTIPVGTNDSITITDPNSDTLVVWGFISDYSVSDLVIDDKVVATLEITVSNLNGSNVETGPAFTDVP